VQVHDFGKINDSYFVAMEYVDGWTLASVLQRCAAAERSIPAPLVALVLRDICLALRFAHAEARGDDGRLLRVVHRDLSPSNVMITRSGQSKITDFGVAKVLGEKAFTQTTTLAGKVSHMAPEQATGAEVDERADLFCVGIMGWELLTLRPLFRKPTDAATLSALLNAAVPPPSLLRPGLAAHWDAFIARAVQRDVEKRFPSAAQMVAELDQMLAIEGAPAPGDLADFLARLPEQVAPRSPREQPALLQTVTATTNERDGRTLADANADPTLLDRREISARQGPVKG